MEKIKLQELLEEMLFHDRARGLSQKTIKWNGNQKLDNNYKVSFEVCSY